LEDLEEDETLTLKTLWVRSGGCCGTNVSDGGFWHKWCRISD